MNDKPTGTPDEQAARLAEAKASLEALMEFLRAFEPKPDAPVPAPASEWESNEELTARHKPAAVGFSLRTF